VEEWTLERKDANIGWGEGYVERADKDL
jgi:hypothetical protein